jgi:BrnA antitoxin of type II toxin-antitoxin system
MDEQTTASSFAQAACPQQTETLLLDTDVLDWIKAEHKNWQGHINELLRFFMDQSQSRERYFAADAFEPGEMDPAPDHPAP